LTIKLSVNRMTIRFDYSDHEKHKNAVLLSPQLFLQNQHSGRKVKTKSQLSLFSRTIVYNIAPRQHRCWNDGEPFATLCRL